MLATEQSMIKEKNQKEIRKYLERNENGTKNCRMWQKIGGKKVKVKVPQLCLILCDLMDCIAHGILQARILGGCSLLQGIFPTQGSNWGLLYCRRILYQLSHKGSPHIKPSNSTPKWTRKIIKWNPKLAKKKKKKNGNNKDQSENKLDKIKRQCQRSLTTRAGS